MFAEGKQVNSPDSRPSDENCEAQNAGIWECLITGTIIAIIAIIFTEEQVRWIIQNFVGNEAA